MVVQEKTCLNCGSLASYEAWVGWDDGDIDYFCSLKCISDYGVPVSGVELLK